MPIAKPPPNGGNGDLQTLREQLVEARTRLAALSETRDAVAKQLSDAQQQVTSAQSQLQTQQGQIGRLQAIADSVAQVTQERDQLRAALAQAGADTEKQVGEAVKNTQDEDAKKLQDAESAWVKEREGLQGRISELEQQLQQAGAGAHVPPSTLASQLASVLGSVSKTPIEAADDARVALTALDVEARGLLQAPGTGESEPRFVPADSAGVEAAKLSTVRMQFRLVPQLPSAEKSPEK